MARTARRRWVGRRGVVDVGVVLAAAVAALAILLLATGHPVFAHTELESSTPADGETVDAPVSEITLVYTAAVTPVENGFEVLDADGQIRRPDIVASPDGGRTHVLRFTQPLAGGPIGARWVVTAADGHVIEGSFSFVVDAPPPVTTTAPAPTATNPPTTVVPPAATTPTASSDAAAPTTDAPPAPPPSSAPVAPTTAVAPTDPPIALEDFLGTTSLRQGDLVVRRVFQGVGIAGVLSGVGLVAFVTLVLRERTGAGPLLLGAAGAGGFVAAIAAVLEAGAHASAVTGRGLGVLSDAGAVSDSLGGTYATAIGLRVVGGLLLASVLFVPARRRDGVPPALLASGAAALVVSYAFDGHTVSKGNRVLQTIADVVHVSAAAIWVGGVIALAALAWRRWSRGGAIDGGGFLEVALRFSSVAAWALLAVAAAGTAMTLSIIDGLGDLTGTGWGKTLLFKVAATLCAAACGAYNRYRILPALSIDPEDATMRERARDALAAEALLLVVVVALAGLLVGATV